MATRMANRAPGISALAGACRTVSHATTAPAIVHATSATPISDVRGSANYRRAMAEVIARRAIAAALTRAGGGVVPIPASPALHGAS